MILRTIKPSGHPSRAEGGAWEAFVPSQATNASILGCISQPAHAALAGRLAICLNGHLFDEVPDEVIEIIGRHDRGWSDIDLVALESAEEIQPMSFISTAPAIAVQAWRRSIAEAETRSALSAYVVRSHFCLLAPRDEDIEHELFRKEEEARLQSAIADLDYDLRDVERFIAFLGFCDLLSLYLCSGWAGDFGLPLAHPAHPSSKGAGSIPISINEGIVHIDKTNVRPGTSVHVTGWKSTGSRALRNQRYEWKFR
jgi:hypothetical protein